MANNKYWERRAARRMYDDMKTAEQAAEDIEKIYIRASQYLQRQGKDVFEAFRRQTGLTEQEARWLLKNAKSIKDMNAVITYARTIQDPEKRRAILRWAKTDATRWRLGRLARLERRITELAPMLYTAEIGRHLTAYSDIIRDAYYHKSFDLQQYSGYGHRVPRMNAKRINDILRQRWYGANYSRRLWGNTRALADAVREELIVSFLTGRPQLEAWRAIEAQFHKGANAARRLIRTESSYMANQANKEAYKDAGVERYIFVATLDLKTSKVCRSMDGKRFLVKNAKAGLNYPPMHPWCRSTTIAWVSEAVLKRMKRDAWDPSTGRWVKVPANMTYNEWYKKFVEGKEDTIKEAPSGGRDLTREQYDRYKDRLGDDFPYSYDEFIRMKENQKLWSAYQDVYRSSKETPYNDLTEIWKYNADHNTAEVSDADYYTAPDGQTYYVDGVNVVLDYDRDGAEINAAPLLSSATGEPVEMCPRLMKDYDGVRSPDYLVGEARSRWDHKGLHGKGKDAVRKRILGKDGKGALQAENYMIDLSDWKGDINDALMQCRKIFKWKNTQFVEKLLVVKDGRIVMALSRK